MLIPQGALCSTDLPQLGTLDLQSGVLFFEAPEGQFEVVQRGYLDDKKRTFAMGVKK